MEKRKKFYFNFSKNEMKLREIKLLEVYVLNFHGLELPEPFGEIINVIKKLILVLSLVNILPAMAPCVTR